MPVGDCERIVDGFLMQPVNAISSLAFVAAGLLLPMVVRRRVGSSRILATLFGSVLVLVGVGSLAFHGPGGTIADWAHDASITALLVLIGATALGRDTRSNNRQLAVRWGGVVAPLILIEAIWPRSANALNAGLAVLAILAVLGSLLVPNLRSSGPARGKLIGATIVALGAGVMLLSRTGGPLCFPDGLVQGHAIWHLAAAGGLGFYAVSGLIGAEMDESTGVGRSRARRIS